ncbi:MAG: ArsR/SmtB family transcription factor [Halobacteriaceae archaeon]
MSVFPIRTPVDPNDPKEPRIINLQSDTAGEVLSALSAVTSKRIYTTLAEQPQTASDLATELDSSIQNVRYHLEKLEQAELIEVKDTWYSAKGSEMNVYGVTDEPIVFFTEETALEEEIKDVVKQALSASGIILLVGLFIHIVFAKSVQRMYFGRVATTGQDVSTSVFKYLLQHPGIIFVAGGFTLLAAFLMSWFVFEYRPKKHRQLSSSMGELD